MKIAQNLGKEFLGKSMGPFKEKDLTDAISNTIERNPKKAVQKLIRLFGDELEEGFDMLGREKDNQNEKALKKYQKKNKSASEEQEEKKRYALQKELEKKAAQKIKLGLEHVSKLMENILGTEEKDINFSGLLSKDKKTQENALTNAAKFLGNAAFKILKNRIEHNEDIDDDIYTQLHESTTNLIKHIEQEIKLFKQSPSISGKIFSAASGVYLGALMLAETASKHMAKAIDSLAPPMLSAMGGLIGGALATAAVEGIAGALGASVAGIPVAPFVAMAGVVAAPIGAMVGKALGQVAGKALGFLAKLTHKGIKSFANKQQIWLNQKRGVKDHFVHVEVDKQQSTYDFKKIPDSDKSQLSAERAFFEKQNWELHPPTSRKANYYFFTKPYEKTNVKLTTQPNTLSLTAQNNHLPRMAIEDLCEGITHCFPSRRIKVEATSLENLQIFLEQASEKNLEISQAKYLDEKGNPVLLSSEQITEIMFKTSQKFIVKNINDS